MPSRSSKEEIAFEMPVLIMRKVLKLEKEIAGDIQAIKEMIG